MCVLSLLNGYRVSLSQIRYLSLPISTATPTAAIILPLLTGIGIRGAQSLLTRSNDNLLKRGSPPSWVLPVFFVALVVYETVIATLAVSQMLPSEALTCQLFERWQSLWSNRDAEAIKRIQDAHNCCGFRYLKDKTWPFAGNHGAETCSIMYGRDRPCLPAWRRDHQINAGLLLLVAVGTFLVKVSPLPPSLFPFAILLSYKPKLRLTLWLSTSKVWRSGPLPWSWSIDATCPSRLRCLDIWRR